MEQHGILDPSNEVHLFALHYTYQPRINRNLSIFTQGHSRAPISSGRGMSPLQLWIQGSMTHSNRAIDEQWSLIVMMDKNPQLHPEEKANFVSKIMLWWIVDLLRQGKSKPLVSEDLYPLKIEEQSEFCTKRLEGTWESELKSARLGKRKPKLWKALLRFYTWVDYTFLISVAFLNVFGSILSIFCAIQLAVVIGSNFDDASSSRSDYLVYLYGVLFGYVVDTTASNQYNRYTPILGIRARSAILGLVYKKVLRQSKISTDSGSVMDLVCNDTTRCLLFSDYFIPYGIRRTIQGFLFVGWLFLLIGWAIIPNVIVVLLLVMCRIYITGIDVVLRQKASEIAGERLKYLRELLTIINPVKQNCLEDIYEEKIYNTRWKEVKKKAKRLVILSLSLSSSVCAAHLLTFVTVIAVALIDHTMLTFQIIFAIAFLSNDISDTFCLAIPTTIHFSTDILVSLVRLGNFLDDDLEFGMIHEGTPCSQIVIKLDDNNLPLKRISSFLSFENVSCTIPQSVKPEYERKQIKELLKNVSLRVQYPGLVVVYGPVGSGKSLLLASILKDELYISQGRVTCSGTLANVSETPWVFPGTIRENILFALPYDEEWYWKCVAACQLEEDFKSFSHGDLSRIGENSATVSGGQRTRIALARAVYSQADIYLLDDPFSSLDIKVAENIFKECLKGLLAHRIVLLTTHEQRYWREADYIVQMDAGEIVAEGRFDDFKDKISENDLGKEDPTKHADDGVESEESINNIVTGAHLQVVEEDRKIGNVSFQIYCKFFLFGARALLLIIIFLIVVAGQGLTVILHVVVATLPNFVTDEGISLNALTLYALVFFITLVMIIIGEFCTVLLPLRASYNVHNKMVSCILKAPTSFFAVNPIGRIFNRFSQDLNNLDELLPFNISYFVLSITPCVGALVLCFIANVYLIPVAIVALVAETFLARFFVGSAMDIKRLMQIGGEPLYSHFSNTMEGLKTIRIYNQQQKFIDVLFRHIDHHHEVMFVYYTSVRWFSITMDLLLLFSFTAVVAIIEIYSDRDASTAATSAVAFMYSYNSVKGLYASVRFAVETNSQMVSAERTLAYTEIEPEKGRKLEKCPPKDWPWTGRISFNNVSLRHYSDGPCALKNLTFEVKACEKIGIAGRTGAGKSSLVAAIMRMAEIEGEIFIDDLNIQDFNIMSTRKCISVISQSPVLIDGTIRENLDPSSEKNDSEIWDALNQLDITSLVQNLPEKLNTKITGTGSNFSVGQRQLLHIARILLNKNKVVIFDEATGKIDKKTAQDIQQIVRRSFKDCTMLIISHRLSTILECDKIIMLDQGTMVEFDQPEVLLGRETGLLRQLLELHNSRR